MGKKVVITGGGTAGHTNPGIAVAQQLVAQGVPVDDIHFIGGKRGNEGKLVPEAGFSISLLPGRGIQRKISFVSLTAALSLLLGAIKGFFLILKIRPKVVLCLGGYAAFPASLAAVFLFRPIVVSEQNARSSAVNRLFGKFAKVCALPFPDTDLPKGKLTGNPALDSIKKTTPESKVEARKFLDIPEDKTLIAVFSGSLGATSVNKSVNELAHEWSNRQDLYIYHVIGKRDWDSYSAEGNSNYRVLEYEYNMAQLLAAADFAVCRAGASTVCELAIAGLGSILVPLPIAPRDAQTANARELERVGGAIIISDDDLTSELLEKQLDPIISDSTKILKMSEAALSVARPEAASDVAKIMIEVGGIDVG